jgi:predicted MFS family arabinose efflux permease
MPRSIGIGRTIILSAALGSPAYLLITFTTSDLSLAAVTLFVGWFVVAMTQVIYNVAQISLRQAITPSEMQSRMNATMRFIVWGTIPIGSIIGGALATFVPVRVALMIAAVGSFSAMVPLLASPLRDLREIPALDESQPDGQPLQAPASTPSARVLTKNEAGLP